MSGRDKSPFRNCTRDSGRALSPTKFVRRETKTILKDMLDTYRAEQVTHRRMPLKHYKMDSHDLLSKLIKEIVVKSILQRRPNKEGMPILMSDLFKMVLCVHLTKH
jgi:hypothetical protein